MSMFFSPCIVETTKSKHGAKIYSAAETFIKLSGRIEQPYCDTELSVNGLTDYSLCCLTGGNKAQLNFSSNYSCRPSSRAAVIYSCMLLPP